MDLTEILAMWNKDSKIDELELDRASLNGSVLHSKYLEIYSRSKLKLKKLEMDFKVLLKKKWLWYNGKMCKSDIDALGWSYEPTGGLKIMKGDMDYYYDSDEDIQNAQLKIEYLKEIVAALKEIMESIKWRHQSVKNAIDFKKFTSGM